MQELQIDYTNCATDAPDGSFGPINSGTVSTAFKSSSQDANVQWSRRTQEHQFGTLGQRFNQTICTLQFDLPTTFAAPVLLYYQLTKFYQNHRRYVKSLDEDQLEGQFRDNSSIKGSYCDPLTLDENGVAYYPCGLIANSLFNDTFSSLTQVTAGSDNASEYVMTNNGIAWSSDASTLR